MTTNFLATIVKSRHGAIQQIHGAIQQISHHPMAQFNKKAAFYGGNMIYNLYLFQASTNGVSN